jgi:hypothetical protein
MSAPVTDGRQEPPEIPAPSARLGHPGRGFRPRNRSSPAENARAMLVKTRGSILWPHGVG